MNYESLIGILNFFFFFFFFFLFVLKHFLKFEVKSDFCQNLKFFYDRGPYQNFRFWPYFESSHIRLVNELSLQMVF